MRSISPVVYPISTSMWSHYLEYLPLSQLHLEFFFFFMIETCLLVLSLLNQNKFGFITVKGNAKGMRSSSSNVHHRLMEIINERRDAMTKSSTPLNVDFLNILLSAKDEDDTITDDNIISTLVVSHLES